ncbi:3-phosphoshikimate 1-carboxyvinyltransferase [Gemmatimonadota bacterium]
MQGRKVARIKSLQGSYAPPGDDLFSHLALIVASLAEGESSLKGMAPGGNVQRTMECLKQLGVEIRYNSINNSASVSGTGALSGGPGFRVPDIPLDCGSSLLTAQLMLGLIAGQEIEATLIGDSLVRQVSLVAITDPLRRMGADITVPVMPLDEGLIEGQGTGSDEDVEPDSISGLPAEDDSVLDASETMTDALPLHIRGGGLAGIEFSSGVADPALKCALLLAGLRSRAVIEYTEPMRSPDHLEKLLKSYGANLETRTTGGGRGEYTVHYEPGLALEGREVDIPGDFTKAVYLMVAALLLPRSDLTLKGVGLNPARREALNVLKRMGGRIEISDRRTIGTESRGDINIRKSKLKGTGVSGGTVRMLFEELAALTVAASLADGESYFKGADALRVSGNDRISALIHNLKVLDLDVGEAPDGLVFRGKSPLDGGVFDSFGDYRVALAIHVCALVCHGESTILNYEVIDQYWPGFPEVIELLKA